jgi:signal transduction histidine kinase
MAGEKELRMRLARLGLIALGYWACVRIGLACVIQPEGLASIWPASGVALGALLLRDRSRWIETLCTLFTVNALTNRMVGNSLAVCIGFASANTAEPALGAWILTRILGTSITLRRLKEVMGLIAVATLANALTSLWRAAVPTLAYGSSYWDAWLVWWVAHGLGILLVTPLLLAWATGKMAWKGLAPSQVIEAVALAVVLTASAWASIALVGNAGRLIIGAYMSIPMILWGALRFGLRGVTMVMVIQNGVTLLNVVRSTGVFAAFLQTPSARLLAAQLLFSIVDVTGIVVAAIFFERRKAEDALMESEEKYRQLAEHSSDVIYKVDMVNEQFTYASPSVERVLGYTAEETSSTMRDITERLEMEHRIQRTKKAESLNRMAGAIAHHYNNLMGVVLGNLELALDDLPRESNPRENIAEAMQASRRAADLSQLMLAYLGQRVGKVEPLDLSELCREALETMRSSLPKKVRLKIELPDQGPIVRAEAIQMKQVLKNLVVNAVEAAGHGEGDITVAICVMQGSGIPKSHVYPAGWEPKAETYACLSVTDTGRGMDAETLEKLFDPFFTTKFSGRGLGLAVVTGTVKAHEGAIAVESRSGQGTTFQVFLPVVTEKR